MRIPRNTPQSHAGNTQHTLTSYYALLQPEIYSLERLIACAPLPVLDRGELAQLIALRLSTGSSTRNRHHHLQA
ncbi:hypothetical protein [Polycladidibacter hongkongensis]|uniref:hypothetical protein n=1 Tax=Polycladidibacter hongkongensis TaxID=1647556 RepID=UPI0008311D77|nr:hypothetical protein [Pseudovibrio hongkongensis]